MTASVLPPSEPTPLGTRQVLVVGVTNPTSTALLAAVRTRAAAGAARFHLLLPDPAGHAEITLGQRRESHAQGEAILASALPLLSAAAGADVDGFVAERHDPMDAIEDAVRSEHIDEIILSTVHHSVSEGLHVDLPRRVAHLGLPVTTIIADEQVAAVV
jgi:hypothetical protein